MSRPLCRFAVPLLAVAAVLLGACASGDSTPVVEGVRMALSARATSRLVLYVKPKPGLETAPNWDAFRGEWEAAMRNACATAGMSFKLAGPGEARPTEPATVVELTVDELTYVPPKQRLAVGFFGSKPSMALQASFIETPSGRHAATRSYGSSAGAWQGLYADTTVKQVELVSLQIVADVVRR